MTHLVDDTDEHVNEIVLSNWDISVILAFAGLASELALHICNARIEQCHGLRRELIDPLTEGADPSRMVDEYDYEWWVPGLVMDLAAPLPWISVNICVENHVRQWPEGSAYVIPSPQTELGEFPFRAQLLLLLERLDLNLLQYEGAIKDKLRDLKSAGANNYACR
ncbi:hypothetical protein BD769DRAFT_1664906 [Suillus cothurnatus]|nr:hypothetical protein BD769DRAFT_1664906 [Suillus cothurnatus]